VKKLILLVALLSLAALGWPGPAHSVALLDNTPNVYVGGHMTQFLLLGALAVLIFLSFVSRRRALRSTAE
jgi:hypothetical protein